MGSALNDSDLLKIDGDNQILILLGNTFYSVFHVVFNSVFLAIHYLSLPAVLMYSLMAHAYEQSWKIAQQVTYEIYELMQILPLSFEAYFWSARCLFEMLFISKSNEQLTVEVEQNVYTPLKKILQLLNALPFSRNHASALYSIMMKLPFFGQGCLPFPNFLFEDTFAKVDFQKGTVSMYITTLENSSQSATENIGNPTSIQTSTVSGHSKLAIVKKKSATRSDNKI